MQRCFVSGFALLGVFSLGGTASPLTVNCGQLLDVKSGQWRERVSTHDGESLDATFHDQPTGLPNRSILGHGQRIAGHYLLDFGCMETVRFMRYLGLLDHKQKPMGRHGSRPIGPAAQQIVLGHDPNHMVAGVDHQSGRVPD
jgi:hypothetical protein